MNNSIQDWAVFRQDHTGNEFIVVRNLTKKRADELVEEFESHGHHQHFWAMQISAGPRNFSVMLNELIRAGTSIDLAIPVLKNQGCTYSECLLAVQGLTRIPANECENLLRPHFDGVAKK